MLRFVNLGTHSFWIDELYHVSSAESNIENGSLHVPFKGEYTRAKPITYLTVASFKLLGSSEFAARLPFVAMNLVFILVSLSCQRCIFICLFACRLITNNL